MSKLPNVLFYSKYCPHCENFIKNLKKSSVFNKFVFICVDVKSIQLPPFVTHVPIIVVYDNNNHRNIFIGKSAFEWLNEFLANPMDVSQYQPCDLQTSLSDKYAFLDGSAEPEHNFTYMDNTNNFYINTPAETSKDVSKMNDSDIKNYEQYRNSIVVNTKPPMSTPDFTKGIENVTSNRSFEQLQAQRKSDFSFHGPPSHAPNFQTSAFKSNMFQSNIGSGYTPLGVDSGTNNHNTSFNNYDSVRNSYNIPRPTTTPDFQRTIRSYN